MYINAFAMLGLPAVAIKARMTQDGVDPTVLDKDPEELVPEEESGK